MTKLCSRQQLHMLFRIDKSLKGQSIPLPSYYTTSDGKSVLIRSKVDIAPPLRNVNSVHLSCFSIT